MCVWWAAVCVHRKPFSSTALLEPYVSWLASSRTVDLQTAEMPQMTETPFASALKSFVFELSSLGGPAADDIPYKLA